jgi:DNA-binding CsgD family transcriptional regulator
MLPLDNVTTIYITSLLAIAFSVTQLILFRKKGFSAYLWAAGYLLIGLGYIVTLQNTANPLPHSWVAGPIAVLLGSLVVLSSLGIWAGYRLPKKASLICLGGVGVTATLFNFSRLFGAPLGSLEVILLAPVSAVLIYSGWFAGIQTMQTKSKYIYLISGVFWVQGAFFTLLTLGALAAKGGDYIVVTSEVVYWTSLINLMAVLIANISWILQISEELLIKDGSINVASMNKLMVKDKNTEKPSLINRENKPVKEKTINKKADSSESISVNPDLLTVAEKNALLERLTEKEREVFLLAAEGKKNGEIASVLNSSEASVKVHRSRLTTKLGMKKPEELKKLIVSASTVIESKEDNQSLPKTDNVQDLFTKT